MSIRRSVLVGGVATLVLAGVALPTAALPGAAAGGRSAPRQEAPSPRDPEVTPDQRLTALVERIRIESSQRRTMEADFVQTKESALLQETLRSSGVFSYESPDLARWEYLEPDPVSLVIRGDEMITWFPDLERAERYQIGRQSQKVLEYLGASTSIIALLEYFDVFLHMPEEVADPYRLRLEPRFKRIEKRIKLLEIWVEPERYLPVRLRYVEADDDVTEYRFRNFRVNEPIPPERFEIDLPAGVEIEDRQIGQGRSGG